MIAVNSRLLFLSTPSARRATKRLSSHGRFSRYFYPRPPRGGRLTILTYMYFIQRISIHALREEGDEGPELGHPLCTISIHALREEGDFFISIFSFLCETISIHALREEGDHSSRAVWTKPKLFLSTPSARRATCSGNADGCRHLHFYPRPPRGGRREHWKEFMGENKISIHALREEGDALIQSRLDETKIISIHALREEGDLQIQKPKGRNGIISIHALREEGDAAKYRRNHQREKISIHALREEGDCCCKQTLREPAEISIHALREEGDC